MSAPTVSVVMPVYNGETYLLEAIRSIQQQDHRPLEIIVVDDGSTDRTAAVLAGLGDATRCIHQSNQGQAAARNRGIRIATGSLIAFLDADDVWSANKLALQLPRLQADSTLEMVRGYTQRLRRCEAGWEVYDQPWPALSLGATLMRRSVFERVGCLDETLPFNEDVDWFVRAKERGISSLVHEDVVQMYRRHGHNITNDRARNSRFFLKALKHSIDRRRSSNDSQ